MSEAVIEQVELSPLPLETSAEHPRFSAYQTAVVLLVFFAVFMSALVSRTVFERLPHLEDEVAYLFQAKTLERGHLVIDTPNPRRAYWQPFVVDYQPTGKRFGKYSLGWPALLAVGVNLGQAWIINAFFAGLNVALIYRLGREIFNRDAGLVAAALTAFSPMALLLNGTLMGHTAALFCATLFMYAYWRLERGGGHALGWGIIAGLALGMIAINRPLTAVGIGAPFVVWSGIRLVRILFGKTSNRPLIWRTLSPLLATAGVTLVVSLAIPIYNFAAAGDPTKNLYTLVWSYDTVGFGECCGRHGHTLEKGVRQARWDLSLTAADLFGWQMGDFREEVKQHLLNDGDYYPNTGLSWVLLPFGLVLGFRRRWGWAWLAVGAGWILLLSPVMNSDAAVRPGYLVLWVFFGIIWTLLPGLVFLFRREDSRTVWPWLLLAVVLCMIGVHLAYWIGSQRYSTRYYFEALTAAALLSALPVAWLARRFGRLPVYALLAAVLVYSLYAYSTPRISLLYRFNRVGQQVIEEVNRRRTGDQPVLVLVTGPRDNVRWRATGSLMAVTSPYLDSDIVVAWDYGDDGVRQAILERFPDRQVIEMGALENDSWFIE